MKWLSSASEFEFISEQVNLTKNITPHQLMVRTSYTFFHVWVRIHVNPFKALQYCPIQRTIASSVSVFLSWDSNSLKISWNLREIIARIYSHRLRFSLQIYIILFEQWNHNFVVYVVSQEMSDLSKKILFKSNHLVLSYIISLSRRTSYFIFY